jgi:2-C-methyl-D-erythritol 2,4-cyclodiphosphate synthase
MYLVGIGSDDHKIVKVSGKNSKPLKLAGVIVSKEYSPVAHSDGDLIAHAVSNALFLAIGERDIGNHFPDTDPNYAGIEGEKMLKYALNLVDEAGYKVSNVAVMITAGKPKMSPYVNLMKKNLAKTLKISADRVGIGATTGEGLSDHGKGKGINAVAQILLEKR